MLAPFFIAKIGSVYLIVLLIPLIFYKPALSLSKICGYYVFCVNSCKSVSKKIRVNLWLKFVY